MVCNFLLPGALISRLLLQAALGTVITTPAYFLALLAAKFVAVPAAHLGGWCFRTRMGERK